MQTENTMSLMDTNMDESEIDAKIVCDAKQVCYNKIRGFLLGGAIGDALGYPVEFLSENQIFAI